MMTLIMGGSGSGKSAYAEDYIDAVSAGKKKYYLATMRIFDKEGQKKIERHKRLREGKGFVTIEQPVSIPNSLHQIEAGEGVALLECMSNLTANEMFQGGSPETKEAVIRKIIVEIKLLKKELDALIIVTNNIFEDGIYYDFATREYQEALGSINEQLTAMADEVIEVVVGIPIVIKKGNIPWY